MENSDLNAIRIEAFKKHGATRIIRLRIADGSLRYYVCQMKNNRILSVLAGGTDKRQILSQL